MRYIFVLIFSLFLLASCKRHEVTNEYKNAKHHPSEDLAKEQKKAAKKAQKVFLKTQKNNKKSQNKKIKFWQKKKKQYR